MKEGSCTGLIRITAFFHICISQNRPAAVSQKTVISEYTVTALAGTRTWSCTVLRSDRGANICNADASNQRIRKTVISSAVVTTPEGNSFGDKDFGNSVS